MLASAAVSTTICNLCQTAVAAGENKSHRAGLTEGARLGSVHGGLHTSEGRSLYRPRKNRRKMSRLSSLNRHMRRHNRRVQSGGTNDWLYVYAWLVPMLPALAYDREQKYVTTRGATEFSWDEAGRRDIIRRSLRHARTLGGTLRAASTSSSWARAAEILLVERLY